ncbi:MAG TPA: riboflavin synthase [Propionicimonas sp.]|jgi:riboflavin synthase
MFTGIIEELGEIVEIRHLEDSAVLAVRGSLVTSDASHGSSVAVNGVCLTVTGLDGDIFSVDVMAESLQRTSLGDLSPGDRVNLERAMTSHDRFGGHIVQGHVDGTGRILSRTPGERWEVVEISCPPEARRYLVEKGSIAVDGVSLTVFDIRPDQFTVSLIPTTLELTTLGTAAIGAVVNLEADILGKYIVAHLDSLQLGGPRQVAHV